MVMMSDLEDPFGDSGSVSWHAVKTVDSCYVFLPNTVRWCLGIMLNKFRYRVHYFLNEIMLYDVLGCDYHINDV